MKHVYKTVAKGPVFRKKGQAMMEYIILIALLAVASIPVVTTLGNIFRDRVMSSAESMTGDEVYRSQATQMGRGAEKKVRRDMRSFYED